MTISNLTFLRTLFGDDYIWTHVTAFHDDPSNIAADNRMRCWAGGWFRDYYIPPATNQYFTISTFYADKQGKARRRKALFRCTHVIVADDVREKLDVAAVERLPKPTYKLQTSPGSEQWGWKLDYPCQDRSMVENLLDGLVAKGLAPDGKDPGMKGVTRYVRLPEGVNTKQSKLVNGQAQPCSMVEWNPEQTVSIQQLAEPFGVDLHADRRDTRTGGASSIGDHPVLGVVTVRQVLSDGRYDVTCPWIDGHTGNADDGAALFTNADGSIGFKCHHGHCEDRTGDDLLNWCEQRQPGFREGFETWKVLRSFGEVAGQGGVEQLDFIGGTSCNKPSAGESVFVGRMVKTEGDREESTCVTNTQQLVISYQAIIDQLRRIPLVDPQAIQFAYAALKAVDQLDHGNRLNYWTQIRDHMGWSKPDLQAIVDQQRKLWYPKRSSEDFYQDYIYIAEQNQFYSSSKKLWLTDKAFQNRYSHIDEDARVQALTEGRSEKVDKFDYVPGLPSVYEERGTKYANGWIDQIEKGVPGDVGRWLFHFDRLGWSEHRTHVLQWMAYTMKYPERKINHILLLAGGEGNGKDFLLYPLYRAMDVNANIIDGDVLLEGFHDHLLCTKYLHINEAELGDKREAKSLSNKLKPLAAAPPERIRVNTKGVKPVNIRNIVNVSMSSNSVMPLNLSRDARRYYAMWTDVTIRGADGQVTPDWQRYWHDRWEWMRDCEGWKACVWYLMNQVDLSSFDPGRVPVLTDFVRDIQDASEDPVSAIIKECISRRISLMMSDIVTPADIQASLKIAPMFNISVDLKSIPSTPVIGKIMKQNGLGTAAKMKKGTDESRVWLIRNADKYKALTHGQLYDEYQRQMVRARVDFSLREVG